MKVTGITALDKPARKGRRSVSDSVALASTIDEDVPLPAGLSFRDDRERVVWGEFTRARVKDNWRSIDLWFVLKMVRLYVESERTEELIAAAGPVVKNDRGTPIVNPLVALHDSQLRLQLAIGSRLGLLQAATIGPGAADPREVAAAALAQARMRKSFGGDAADDLIPR